MDDYESCYYTGVYRDQDCSQCPYASDCSASEIDEEDYE